MKAKLISVIGIGVALGCVAVWALLSRLHQVPATVAATSSRRETVRELSAVRAGPLPAPTPETPPVVQEKPAPRSPDREPVKAGSAPKVAPSTGSRPGKPPLMDPGARLALVFVGVDPDAEEYWFGAINDPSLPASERQDLIEDLNEVGLSDPRNPAPEDLPVILSRLQILEQMDPMDQVNYDAMNEAHKDLINLARLASGTGGKPVD